MVDDGQRVVPVGVLIADIVVDDRGLRASAEFDAAIDVFLEQGIGLARHRGRVAALGKLAHDDAVQQPLHVAGDVKETQDQEAAGTGGVGHVRQHQHRIVHMRQHPEADGEVVFRFSDRRIEDVANPEANRIL